MSDPSSARDARRSRISISLPTEVHGRLQVLSSRQQRSLSNLCALLLTEALDRAEAESL